MYTHSVSTVVRAVTKQQHKHANNCHTHVIILHISERKTTPEVFACATLQLKQYQ